MKVILQKNVDKLGKVGDVAEVAAGYYRNFLQPRGFAVLASQGAMKKRDADLDQLRKKADDAHSAAVALGERIKELGLLKIEVKAGEGGRLYGKVTNKEIAQVLTEKLGTEIDKRMVKTADDISALGTYKAHVKLTPEVHSEVTVEVQPHGYAESDAGKKAARVAAEKAEAEANGTGEDAEGADSEDADEADAAAES